MIRPRTPPRSRTPPNGEVKSRRRAATPPPLNGSRTQTPPPVSSAGEALIKAGSRIRCTFSGGVAVRSSQDYTDKIGDSVGLDEIVLVDERQGSWVRTQAGWLPLVARKSGTLMFEDVDARSPNPAESGAPFATAASHQPSSEGNNVQVFARFRPVADRKDHLETCVECGDDGLSCSLSNDGKEHLFQFSRVFSPWASQDDVYMAVGRSIIDGVIHGFNGAIIAYGQTGSGKTHTMVGPGGAEDIIGGRFDGPDNGIIPRALLELQAYAAPTAGAVKLRVSYVEVYQEKIVDLLSPHGKFVCNTIRQDAARGLWIPDVTEMPVQAASEAMEIMRTGNKNRAKAATEMNSDSSRSHAIFIVTVQSDMDVGKVRFAQLYLVDLAGSERLSRSTFGNSEKDAEELRKRMDETKLINQSLLALGKVISALSSRSSYVPYRDSKLTRLLRNSLGGNARTSIVVTGSILTEHGHETLSTLRFGDRAAMIKNVAKVNVSVNAAELKKQLQRAREEVQELRSECARLERDNHLLRNMSRLPLPAAAQARGPFISDEAGKSQAVGAPDAAPTTADTQGCADPAESARLMAQRLLICELLPTFLCPLTSGVMREPVFATDGFTYERSAIEKHIQNAGRMPAMSPSTGQHLPSKVLVPNAVLKQMIRRHLADLPPVQGKVCGILRVGMRKLDIILSCLDGLSLGRTQVTCTLLMANGAASSLWKQVLAKEFPDTAKEKEAKGEEDPRKCYIALRYTRGKKIAADQARPSKGLHLFSPAQRIRTTS